MAFLRVWRLMAKFSHNSFNGSLPVIAICTTSYLSSGPISFHVAIDVLLLRFISRFQSKRLAQANGLVHLVAHLDFNLFAPALHPHIGLAQLPEQE